MEQGKIIEAEEPIVRVSATPTGLTAPPLHPRPQGFFTGRIPFLPPNQQHQSTEGKKQLKNIHENRNYINWTERKRAHPRTGCGDKCPSLRRL